MKQTVTTSTTRIAIVGIAALVAALTIASWCLFGASPADASLTKTEHASRRPPTALPSARGSHDSHPASAQDISVPSADDGTPEDPAENPEDPKRARHPMEW
ncbi:hypothetical protein [Azoarcus sp. KH32C]|uniref:hypothetical protein n=1 Tax=Azoarcus sp. KH32C TaxID=748247 RepID=UPI00023869CA|nr:hypothetical protein [Azoarcus sp. KH32C]BAL26482.1 hypothetical protein AZKH_4203 [Azoarcus sp. KH32C]